jgi:hypothetical protein
MKLSSVLEAPRKKKASEPSLPYDPNWDALAQLKERAALNGRELAGKFQLFVPRPHRDGMSNRDRRMSNLANKYAYDDEGNIKPQYAKWQGDQVESVQEAAPILAPGMGDTPPGGNKPARAFWTSTAVREHDGTWSSDWSRWVADNQPSWSAETGYLYRIRPNLLILPLETDYDAEDIIRAFAGLDRGAPIDHSQQYSQLTGKFPWDAIAKHFDGVHHRGYGGHGGGFTYGWDVESTAWFKSDALQLIKEVPIYRGKEEEEDY